MLVGAVSSEQSDRAVPVITPLSYENPLTSVKTIQVEVEVKDIAMHGGDIRHASSHSEAVEIPGGEFAVVPTAM